MNFNKKGSLTSTQLTITILLVVGFALLLFLFIKFLWEPNINVQTCEQSVILRGTASSLSGLLQGFVPLKCKTNKYCISSRLIGEQCDEFAGESGVTKISVTNPDEIEKFISGEIVSCWSMMGQGKVDLFSQWLADTYALGTVYPTCVMCSRIAYDKESLKASKIDLSKIDVVEYMASHKMPDKDISYYDYLAGEGAKFTDDVKTKTGFEVLNDMVDPNKAPTPEEQKAVSEFNKPGGEVDTSSIELVTQDAPEQQSYDKEIGILFMQISAPSAGDVLKNTFLSIVGLTNAKASISTIKPGTWISAPWDKIKGSIFGGGTTTTGVGFSTRVVPNKNIFVRIKDAWKGGEIGFTKTAKIAGAVTLILGLAQQGMVAWNQDVSAGYCGDVSSAGEARDGCSVVRTMEYNVTQIANYCSWFEGVS